jgi:hypothetical protein
MADSSSRTQITVAIIGLLGVLAAALISNWDRIAGTHGKDAASQAHTEATSPTPRAVNPSPQASPTPRPANPSPQATSLGDGPEGFMIEEASPPSGAHLKQGQPTQFTVKVRYRLTTLENATLSVGIAEYPYASGCDKSGNIPASVEVAASRGEHTVTIPIQWTVGVGKQIIKSGSIGYEASFYSDLKSFQMLRSFGTIPGYCYSFD